MNNFWVVKFIKMLAFIALFVLVIGTAVMIVWNILMPEIFNLPYITFGQAIGLTVLCRLLTGSFRTGMSHNGGDSWEIKQKMWEKWGQMTPEEREKWKTEWRARCSHRRPIGWKITESQDQNNDQI